MRLISFDHPNYHSPLKCANSESDCRWLRYISGYAVIENRVACVAVFSFIKHNIKSHLMYIFRLI